LLHFGVETATENINDSSGNDTYQFVNDFRDTVINNLPPSGGTTPHGEVDFLSGITDEKLWFRQSGNNLQIDLLGTTDHLTISGWYGANAGAQVQTFTANGLHLTTQVAQLVAAMASYGAAHTGFNPTTATTATAMPTDTTLQNTIAASWHT